MVSPDRLVPIAPRAWNTWAGAWPARMVNLPLGLAIRPCAYAASRNAFTEFPAAGGGVDLGPRSIDGEEVSFRLGHAGTEISWRYALSEQGVLSGAWMGEKFGEWGLRFWIVLALEWLPPGQGAPVEWRFDSRSSALLASHDGVSVALVGLAAPLLATFHAGMEELQAELERFGYFYLESRGKRGTFPCLRYNLEEMRFFQFAIAIAEDEDKAIAHAYAELDAPAPDWERAPEPGTPADALAALRDVIGWNTVWDGVNNRPYTSLSRNWVEQKFGGFGLWLDDMFYHAWMAALLSPRIARENLVAVLSNAQPDGNLPCLMTGRDSWIDRSQPPMLSLATWMIWAHTGDEGIIDLAYDKLLANHDWWFRRRDGNGDGLMEWGSSDVGEGLYIGTKLAAKDESSMDNSPIHDEAEWNPRSRTLNAADVGLNALLALDGEVLAEFAARRGDGATANRLNQRAWDLGKQVREQLWDAERGIFANRLWSGHFVRSLAPTSFYPLLAGIADPEQIEALRRSFADPNRFGGRHVLPSVTRDDPAYGDNVYWRGRVWPPLNLLVYLGLGRAGLAKEAGDLAQASWRMFQEAWRRRQCPENFNAETGEADDQPDTDLFYSWGALMALLPVIDLISLTPWDGWSLRHPESNLEFGPILVRGRRTRLRCREGWAIVRQEGRRKLAFGGVARLRRLVLEETGFGCEIAQGKMRWALHLGDGAPDIEWAGKALVANPSEDGNWWEVALDPPPGKLDCHLQVKWRQ